MNIPEIKALLDAPESFEKDERLMENAQSWLRELLDENKSLSIRLENLNLAIAEWANQRGHGALFFKELEIVMDQIKERRR